jgi:hypothetical protein
MISNLRREMRCFLVISRYLLSKSKIVCQQRKIIPFMEDSWLSFSLMGFMLFNVVQELVPIIYWNWELERENIEPNYEWIRESKKSAVSILITANLR